MCGIAGFTTDSGPRAVRRPEAAGRIASMTAALEHRGPDAQRAVVLDGVALGHTRLSIVDPAGGDQPMRSAGTGVCLVETGRGREAYTTLLDVVVRGFEAPELLPRALYYLGAAAPLFADEVEKQGGKGQFLREEGKKWWLDLKERYPGSAWAEKVK